MTGKRKNRGADGTNPRDHSYVPSNDGVAEVLGGDELSTRTMTHYPVLEGIRRLQVAHRAGHFWESIESAMARCDAVMAAHGWHRANEIPKSFPGDRDSEPFSDLWYAGHIGSMCWLVLNKRDTGELPEVTLARIMQIGMRLNDWEWRSRYKPSILTGKKQREVLSEHRQTAIMTRKAGAMERREIINAMLEETNLTAGALEKYLQKRLFAEAEIRTGVRTIRRDLKALRGA